MITRRGAMTRAEAIETLNLLAKHGGSDGKAAAAIGIPRTTMQGRSTRARQIMAEEDQPVIQEPELDPIVIPAKPRVRVLAGRPGGAKMKVLAIGDTHVSPHLANDRFRWFGQLAKDERVNKIVQIGDLGTWESVNRHVPNETFNGRLKGTFLEDCAAVNDALLKMNEGLDGYEVERHDTLGNHDNWLWKFEDSAPEVSGMMQLELTSILERHGWTWSMYGDFHFLGGVGFTHIPLNRLGRPYGGKTAENQISNDAVFDVVAGHSHVYRVLRAPKIGPSRHITVVNLGCALPEGHIEEYAQHTVTGWSWGVVLLTIQGGQITETKFVSMGELEEKYGTAA